MEIAKDYKILITGGTGFIGSYIARRLVKNGYKEVTILKRRESRTELIEDIKPNLKFLTGNINDVPFLDEVISDFDCVIHSAAIMSYNPRKDNTMRHVNVVGTANIVNAALDANLKKFIHISSIAALGRKKDEEVINELFDWQKSKYNTRYAISKYMAEQEVWRAYAEGLNVSVVNPAFVVGAGFWDSSSPSLFSKLKKGLPFYPSGGNGFVDVRDIAQGVQKIIEGDFNGERFILSAENWSYEKFLKKIAKEIDAPIPKKELTKHLAKVIIYFEKLRSWFIKTDPIITQDSYNSTSISSLYENQKSIDELGLNYRPLSQTIEESAKSFNESHTKGYGLF